MEELLSPIALYPDPILPQVLPASTFVDQLDEASRVLDGKVNESLIDDTPAQTSALRAGITLMFDPSACYFVMLFLSLLYGALRELCSTLEARRSQNFIGHLSRRLESDGLTQVIQEDR